MPDREKEVINGLEHCLDLLKEQAKQIDDLKAELAKTEDNFSEYVEMMKEKQVPVEPVPDEYRLHYKCGACGRLLNDSILFRDNFCRRCGKEVKWD